LGENVLHGSTGMYPIFGYTQKNKHSPCSIDFYLKHLSQQSIDQGKLERDRIANSTVSEYNWVYEIKSNDGKIKKLETYSKVIRDDKGVPVRYIGTTKDVTELKNYEKNLEKIINELNRSNQELEEFAYVASHDLQEPLRKLSTFTERLTSKYGDKLDDDGKLYVERILAAADNMRSLIENLLEFSRVAKANAQFDPVNLNDILATIKNDQEISIEETRAQLHYPELPVIDGIKIQLLQLFNNLVGNAIKFRKKEIPPVINITCTETPAEVKFSYVLPMHIKHYTIQVQDNGIGFEQEYAQRIFQIFQRLHGKAEYPGTGLGLAICKKIVDNHKGIIYADGIAGTGTIITIILPEKID